MTLAAAGVFALSASAGSGDGHNCGGYRQLVKTEKSTVTLAATKVRVRKTARSGMETIKVESWCPARAPHTRLDQASPIQEGASLVLRLS